jgi:glycosyltransferase involved in cell wall biosynthesis
MDHRLPPRVTYWTGTWDPSREAISKEVEMLRRRSAVLAPVVSFSPGQRSAFEPGQRVLRLSHRRWVTLRAVAALVERRGDITHVFGGFSSWHLLRALGRRPILVTAVVARRDGERLPNRDVACVAVEGESAIEDWVNAGIPRDRVVTLLPGVDLVWFQYTEPPPPARFTMLFASTPADAHEIEGRGIPLLVETARARPDIDVLLPWRNWGNLPAARRTLEALRPPPNVHIHYETITDIRAMYSQAHCVVATFRPGFGKLCPNSVIEALACGRPAIVSANCGIASLVLRTGSGIVVSPTVRDITQAIDVIKETFPDYSRRARVAAEACFDVRRFLDEYQQLYQRLQVMQAHSVSRHE